jgi:branched-chain amino acid transport system ATP-binding protein
MLLEVKNIIIHYEKAEALKGVTIHVGEGEIVTIIGSNGAGKTTTLKAISGLVKPSSGEIWFNGQRIDKRPVESLVKGGISFCMEGRRLFPFMTVLENLQMGAFSRRDRGEISRDLQNVFERFPVLQERKKQKAGTLSGGEQQMLAIGRALMSRPKLLLLDEPSLGLAPMVVANLAKNIKELNKSGLTLLLVEQNARMALRIAHRGYVLEVGKVTTEGDTKSLRGNDHVRRAYLGG